MTRPDDDEPREPLRPWRVEVSWQEEADPGFYTGRHHEGPRPLVAFAESVGPWLRRDDAVCAAMEQARLRPEATVELVNVADPKVLAVTYTAHGPARPVAQQVDAGPTGDLQARTAAMAARARADAPPPDMDRFGRRP